MTIVQTPPFTELYVGDIWEVGWQFSTFVQAQVTAGGNDQAGAGTSESVTATTTIDWPAILPGQSILAMDYAQLDQTQFGFELLSVTALANGSGQSWTLTRGASGTTPTGHASPWTLVPVVVTGGEPAAAKLPADPTSLSVVWDVVALAGTTGQETTLAYTGASTPARNSVWRSATGLYRAWIDTTGAAAGTIIAQAQALGTAQKVAPWKATLVAPPI